MNSKPCLATILVEASEFLVADVEAEDYVAFANIPAGKFDWAPEGAVVLVDGRDADLDDDEADLSDVFDVWLIQNGKISGEAPVFTYRVMRG